MIRTLVVEDDAFVADAHRIAAERVPGFEVVAVAHLGADALRILATYKIDLVLMDFYLPDMSGLHVCRTLRGHGNPVDVIAVTSARNLDLVRSAVSLGVVHYLLKPFSFAAFREKLEAYAEYRRRTTEASHTLGQNDVDHALAALHEHGNTPLPNGLASKTLATIVAMLRTGNSRSAADIATGVGISRPTARRYLDYLAEHRLVSQEPRYGGTGRPEHIYTWCGATDSPRVGLVATRAAVWRAPWWLRGHAGCRAPARVGPDRGRRAGVAGRAGGRWVGTVAGRRAGGDFRAAEPAR